MTAKVPIAIFNKPFTSAVAATTGIGSPSEFSFSLSTNFSSGPSLRLSYSPSASLPFSLSLKSGLGLLGHPAHSPLVFSANFSLSPTQSPIPSFFLHFKPQFGHFSLHKTVFSDSNTQQPPSPQTETSSVADESSSAWHNLKLEPLGNQIDKSDLVKKNFPKYGVRVMARTVFPVARGFHLNFRWGLNFPRDFGSNIPSLTVNKIRLERVEEGRENSENDNKQRTDTSENDLNLLKGMCFWMGRDLENVERENREMKRVLGEMKMGVSSQREVNKNNGGGRKFRESSGEFQRWKSNRNGKQEDEKKEQENKSQQSDVESELQKAIKAATS